MDEKPEDKTRLRFEELRSEAEKEGPATAMLLEIGNLNDLGKLESFDISMFDLTEFINKVEGEMESKVSLTDRLKVVGDELRDALICPLDLGAVRYLQPHLDKVTGFARKVVSKMAAKDSLERVRLTLIAEIVAPLHDMMKLYVPFEKNNSGNPDKFYIDGHEEMIGAFLGVPGIRGLIVKAVKGSEGFENITDDELEYLVDEAIAVARNHENIDSLTTRGKRVETARESRSQDELPKWDDLEFATPDSEMTMRELFFMLDTFTDEFMIGSEQIYFQADLVSMRMELNDRTGKMEYVSRFLDLVDRHLSPGGKVFSPDWVRQSVEIITNTLKKLETQYHFNLSLPAGVSSIRDLLMGTVQKVARKSRLEWTKQQDKTWEEANKKVRAIDNAFPNLMAA